MYRRIVLPVQRPAIKSLGDLDADDCLHNLKSQVDVSCLMMSYRKPPVCLDLNAHKNTLSKFNLRLI